MKRLTVGIATFLVAIVGAFALVPAAPAGALDPLAGVCSEVDGSQICENRDEDGGDLIGTVVNTLLFAVGTLSVIMIIVAGIMYTVSSGDAGKVARAKNTLTYSIVGLVVAFLAYAIVNWVFRLF